jgi:hypothetical protein
MEKIVKTLSGMSANERRDFIEAHATRTLTQSYLKPMTEGELRQAQEDFAQWAIDKAKIDDDFSKVKEEFKGMLKPLNSKISQKLTSIKTRAQEVNGPVHQIPDYDNFYMHTVADDGTYLSGRMMLPEERQSQMTFKSATLKANNE